MIKPKERSEVRLYVGRIYYIFKRYLKWYFGKENYARRKEEELKPYVVFQHKTPLLRRLRNVDMWMQYNKIKNLELAIKKIDRVVVNPKEAFSFWKLVGRTSKRKGYLEGMILTQGSFKPGTGGGLCQLSNLIYWMTIHSPLTVTERYRHSYDVFPDSKRTQPFGSGATVSYNYIDLQILNETNQSYQLHIYLDDEYLYGEWRAAVKPIYRYEIYEKRHWINHEFWGGYTRHNEIYRRVFNPDDELIADEFLTENHAIMMYQPLLEQAE